MSNDGIKSAAELQSAIKKVVSDAVWGGMRKDVIWAILLAEAEAAKS